MYSKTSELTHKISISHASITTFDTTILPRNSSSDTDDSPDMSNQLKSVVVDPQQRNICEGGAIDHTSDCDVKPTSTKSYCSAESYSDLKGISKDVKSTL